MSEQIQGPTNNEIIEQVKPDLKAAYEASDDSRFRTTMHNASTHNGVTEQSFGGQRIGDARIDVSRDKFSTRRVDARVEVPNSEGQPIEYHGYRSEYPTEFASTTVKRPGYEARIKNPKAVELAAKLAGKQMTKRAFDITEEKSTRAARAA